MTHLWVRAEQRQNERRVGLTPDGASALIAAGMTVTVEDSPDRIIPTDQYRSAGCVVAAPGSWTGAPADTIILGLKELPKDGTPLIHRHIMFGHAFKGQPSGPALLTRFRAGGGTLLDLEYLTDVDGRRVAAFGYWAGYAGAYVALECWIAAQNGGICPPVTAFDTALDLQDELAGHLDGFDPYPSVLVIGAKGRVGTGASDLCESLGIVVTKWDMAETADGGPFPEILKHDIFLNSILAMPGCPVFVPSEAKTLLRRLSVIGDIACDPDSPYSPIKVYDRITGWDRPALRVHDDPVLDVTAIDNLPSLLPKESSEDFAAQLLPHLLTLDTSQDDIWQRAGRVFDAHLVTD